MGDPGYVRGIALADTTKSSSVTKALEMLVQQKIQNELLNDVSGKSKKELIKLGWAKSLRLIQRIGANARYFTDSSSKIPRDVALVLAEAIWNLECRPGWNLKILAVLWK